MSTNGTNTTHQQEMFLKEIKEFKDTRYGNVTLFTNPNTETFYSRKTKLFQSKTQVSEVVSHINKRINTPNIFYVAPLTYEFDDIYSKTAQKQLPVLRLFMPYPEENLETELQTRIAEDRPFNNQEVTFMMYDIMHGFYHLQLLGFSHGRFGPEFVATTTTGFAILDDPLHFPHEVINLKKRKEWYLSPLAYKNAMLKKRAGKDYNLFKADVFSFGLVLLEAGIQMNISDIYQGKEIDFDALEEYVDLLKARYPENNLFVSTVKKMLTKEEKDRPDFKEMLERMPPYQLIQSYFNQNVAMTVEERQSMRASIHGSCGVTMEVKEFAKKKPKGTENMRISSIKNSRYIDQMEENNNKQPTEKEESLKEETLLDEEEEYIKDPEMKDMIVSEVIEKDVVNNMKDAQKEKEKEAESKLKDSFSGLKPKLAIRRNSSMKKKKKESKIKIEVKMKKPPTPKKTPKKQKASLLKTNYLNQQEQEEEEEDPESKLEPSIIDSKVKSWRRKLEGDMSETAGSVLGAGQKGAYAGIDIDALVKQKVMEELEKIKKIQAKQEEEEKKKQKEKEEKERQRKIEELARKEEELKRKEEEIRRKEEEEKIRVEIEKRRREEEEEKKRREDERMKREEERLKMIQENKDMKTELLKKRIVRLSENDTSLGGEQPHTPTKSINGRTKSMNVLENKPKFNKKKQAHIQEEKEDSPKAKEKTQEEVQYPSLPQGDLGPIFVNVKPPTLQELPTGWKKEGSHFLTPQGLRVQRVMEIGRKFSLEGMLEDYKEIKWRRVTEEELKKEQEKAKKREIQETLSTPQRRGMGERVNSMKPTPNKSVVERSCSPLMNRSRTQANFSHHSPSHVYSPISPYRQSRGEMTPNSQRQGNYRAQNSRQGEPLVINPIRQKERSMKSTKTPQKVKANPFYREIEQNLSPFKTTDHPVQIHQQSLNQQSLNQQSMNQQSMNQQSMNQQSLHQQSLQPNFHFNQTSQQRAMHISPYKSNPQFQAFQQQQNFDYIDQKENNFQSANNQQYQNDNRMSKGLKKPILGQIPIKKDSNRNADPNELQKIYYHNESGLPVTPNTTFDKGHQPLSQLVQQQAPHHHLKPEILNITRNSEILESPNKFNDPNYSDDNIQLNLNPNTENGNNLIINIDQNGDHLESVEETVSYKTGTHLNRGSIEQGSMNHFSSLNHPFLTQQSLNQNSLNNLKNLAKKPDQAFLKVYEKDQQQHDNISFTTSKHTTSYNYTFQDKDNISQTQPIDSGQIFVDQTNLARIDEIPMQQQQTLKSKKQSAWTREKLQKISYQQQQKMYQNGQYPQNGYNENYRPNRNEHGHTSYDNFVQQQIGNVQYDFFPN